MLTHLDYIPTNEELNRVYTTNSKPEPTIEDVLQHLNQTEEKLVKIDKQQKATFAVCLVILVLLLILNSFIGIKVLTKQVGLVALIDPPNVGIEIPDWDPNATTPPVDDRVERLNEKLEEGKMCISMVGSIVFTDASSAGYMNIFNDDANNYPQFVTLLLDSDNSIIYQSGLVEPGKCIIYDTLDVTLSKGTYECTALFSQVNPESSKICGQAAAKVTEIVKNLHSPQT